jgi:hypothetical protein
MKLTNKYNLPETFVNVLQRSNYTKGKAHLSVTELINSPRITQLRKKHFDEIEEDVADKVWAIFGTAIHAVLEHGKGENHVIEQRLHANMDGYDISGAIDLQEVDADGIHISDYKTTGAWSVMNDKKDWEQQLNCYAWLVEKVKKVPVKSIKIIAIIRDWSRRDAGYKEGYPEAPIKSIDVPLWSFQDREDFIKEKIRLHSDALFALETGDNLPVCTPEQMWEKQTSYAVLKVGGKRATAVFGTQEEADEKLQSLGKGYEIQVRPGERTRCANFCQVNQFCEQWKLYQEGEVK